MQTTSGVLVALCTALVLVQCLNIVDLTLDESQDNTTCLNGTDCDLQSENISTVDVSEMSTEETRTPDVTAKPTEAPITTVQPEITSQPPSKSKSKRYRRKTRQTEIEICNCDLTVSKKHCCRI